MQATKWPQTCAQRALMHHKRLSQVVRGTSPWHRLETSFETGHHYGEFLETGENKKIYYTQTNKLLFFFWFQEFRRSDARFQGRFQGGFKEILKAMLFSSLSCEEQWKKSNEAVKNTTVWRWEIANSGAMLLEYSGAHKKSTRNNSRRKEKLGRMTTWRNGGSIAQLNMNARESMSRADLWRSS